MQIKVGWGGIAGIALNAPAFFASVKWLLDWKGRYDAGASVVTDLVAYLPLWFYPLALVVGVLLLWWDSRRTKREVTIEITPLAAAAVATILAAGCWGWFAYDRWRGPIEWNFNVGSPVTWQKVEGHPLWIGGFQVMGRNRWDEPVLPIEAYIRSEINGHVEPLLLDGGAGYGPVGKVAIPGNVAFTLRAPLHPTPPQAQGQLLVGDFLKTYGRFTLVFKYEGGQSVRRFSEDDVSKIIGAANEAASPASSAPKGVVLRGR